ncbi:hypothetical protein, partial [Vibrio anguillarum]
MARTLCKLVFPLLCSEANMFTVRNFGNDTQCATVPDLKKALSKYAGLDVSIQYRKPSGLLDVKFVSVANDGAILSTYTNEPFEFNSLLG